MYVILLHGINDVTHILELTESFIRYMIAISEEYDKNNTKQEIKKEEPDSTTSIYDRKKAKHCTYIQYDVSSSMTEFKMTIK